MLQAKFCIVHHPLKKWYIEDIQVAGCYACIILHNMMVEKRIDDGEEENVGMYDIDEEDNVPHATVPVPLDMELEQVERDE